MQCPRKGSAEKLVEVYKAGVAQIHSNVGWNPQGGPHHGRQGEQRAREVTCCWEAAAASSITDAERTLFTESTFSVH
jgi:hypothetical protein